jgi:acetylornithine deacetylase/succinyl-diaminopimelate desuccinylase-like protein
VQCVSIVLACACLCAAGLDDNPVDVSALVMRPDVRDALDAAMSGARVTTADQIRFCEIPAPPFKERARAAALEQTFRALGLANVRQDKAGNVLGDRAGLSDRPRLVVAAHLDTVFPDITPTRVTRNGSTLRGPGIGDNCRGLAVLVAVVRSLQQAKVQTRGSVTFVANVGEEGLGDLRGVRELFDKTMKDRVDAFVAIDGAGTYLANVAVGSRRYRVTFRGPGGHAFADFGTPSPIYAMGRAIEKLASLQLPRQPATTFNVGRVGGGTSVNAIASECWMEVDLRSSDRAALGALDTNFRNLVDQAVGEESARWNRPRAIQAELALVGDRPPGITPADSAIVRTGLAAASVLHLKMPFAESSTDANIPTQLKIPAVAIGAGGSGSGAHTVEERFDTAAAVDGITYAVLLTIALSS